MSLLTNEARSKADVLILELKSKLSVELSDEDWRKLLRCGQVIASETVVLVKNRLNNL
jgi:hypothetical protein